ncbi:MAG TPA: methylated-DNA--[protein]-cysteine S-methyltransferase [Thermoplasmata archaeon]
MPMKEIFQTPIGSVAVQTDGGVVQEVHLGARGRPQAVSTPVARDLARYFSGESVDFGRYDVDLSGYTEFERKVYAATRRIPPGEVRTYGDIARAIGKPGASRAVGNALGKNPACIVIPCHRVVASDGLGGFTGGLAWKRRLLHLEGSP